MNNTHESAYNIGRHDYITAYNTQNLKVKKKNSNETTYRSWIHFGVPPKKPILFLLTFLVGYRKKLC